MVSARTPRAIRHLPHTIVATVMVVCAPALTVWALRASGVVNSALLAVFIGVSLSVGASFIGSAYWMSSGRSEDMLFSDLLVWGWLGRLRAERRLNQALERLGRLHSGQEVSSGAEPGLLQQLAGALE